MSRGIGLLLLGAVVGAIAAVGGLALSGKMRDAEGMIHSFMQVSPPDRSGETAPPRTERVTALGTLEPRVGPVLVGSPLAGTRIETVLVREGQVVTKGTSLIRLDRQAIEKEYQVATQQRAEALERQASELKLSEQRIKTAQQAVDQLKQTRDPELKAQRGRFELTEIKVKQAEKDLQRLTALREGPDPLASGQQVDQQQLLVDVAKSDRDAAKVALQQLELSLDFQAQKADAELTAAKESKAIAESKAAIELLDRRLELAALKLDETEVKAPADGTVLRLSANPGELVTTQPLVQLADLTDMVCSVEVDVADLQRLGLPQHGEPDAKQATPKSTLSCRAFGGNTLHGGAILSVRNVAGSAMLRPIDPRKTIDRSVALVTMAIDAEKAREWIGPSGSDAVLALVGLQVDVVFDLNPSNP